jgi:GAF domain-containing protein
LTDESVEADELRTLLSLVDAEQSRADVLMNVVIPIGAALAYETEWGRLLERIVRDAMKLCTADGGVLYLRDPGISSDSAHRNSGAPVRPDGLTPVIVRVDSMGIAIGGSRETVASLCRPARPDSAVAQAAARGASVSLPEAYEESTGLWLCGEAERFFELTEYRTRSCLAVPLRGQGGSVIGVLRLFNARRPDDLEISPFEPGMQQVVESLCLLAAAAVESYVRQQRLKDHVRELTIRIDETRKGHDVSAIVQSDYFKALQSRAKALRTGGGGGGGNANGG